MKLVIIVLVLALTGCTTYNGPVKPMESGKMYRSSSGGYAVYDQYGNKTLDYTPTQPRYAPKYRSK